MNEFLLILLMWIINNIVEYKKFIQLKTLSQYKYLQNLPQPVSESVEDPAELEMAIAHLVTNLPSPDSEGSLNSSPYSGVENQDCLNDNQSYLTNYPWQIRLKSAGKRPLTSATETEDSNKRHKGSKGKSTLSVSMHQRSRTGNDVTNANGDRW